MGKEYKLLKESISESEFLNKSLYVWIILIISMHKCLREAIFNDGGFIYYLQFLLLRVYCLVPIFCIKLLFIFPLFLISSTFHFYHLDTYLITNHNRKQNLKNLTPYINSRD